MVTDRAASKLHDRVLDNIGQRIVAEDLAAGVALTLDDIATQHGVSRTVMREVVRVLETMGLVVARRRVGIIVQPRDLWNVFDPRLIRWRLGSDERTGFLLTLSELRRGFEPVAAALAAERANDDQCRMMAAAVSDMSSYGRSGDLDRYLLADKTFHSTLLEASGNEMFRSMKEVVAEVLTGRTHHGMMPTTPKPAAIELHDDVARAIRLRDPAAAEKAMRAIITEAAQAVSATTDGH